VAAGPADPAPGRAARPGVPVPGPVAGPAGREPRTATAPVVLLAEHEPAVAELSRRYLVRAGLEVRVTPGPAEVTAALSERSAAVAVLDLTMPGLDTRRLRRLLAEPRGREANGERGSALARATTRAPGRMPAVFLLGGGMRPRDLRVSADACLARPFSPRLLVAKVLAVLPRANGTRAAAAPRVAKAEPAGHSVAGLILDPAGRRVTCRGRDVALTPTEFALLTALASNAGRVMTRDRLLAALGERGASGRAVDVYVAQLRAKLPGNGAIRTVRGVGYTLDAPHG
jgi:DNA-binding response OmpR family regulator